MTIKVINSSADTHLCAKVSVQVVIIAWQACIFWRVIWVGTRT